MSDFQGLRDFRLKSLLIACLISLNLFLALCYYFINDLFNSRFIAYLNKSLFLHDFFSIFSCLIHFLKNSFGDLSADRAFIDVSMIGCLAD